MVSQQERQQILPRLVLLVLFLSLFLAACERPLQDNGDAPDADTLTQADPDQGGGTPGDTVDEAESGDAGDADAGEAGDSEEPAAEADTGADAEMAEEEETAEEPAEGEEEAADEPAAEESATEDEPAAEEPDEASEEAVTEAEGEEEAEPELVESAEGDEAEAASPRPDEEATATPVPVSPEATEEEAMGGQAEQTVHIVQPGENLYRIGLRYGVSWVALARSNPGITNPNRITVGQAIIIPGDPDAGGGVPGPGTETTYVVRPGDTLYKIGRAFGIPWTSIAQANNIVNPNRIYVGQVLTLPAGSSGPGPGFTHTVQTGETLFLVSLQYGVPWTSIAAANQLSPPYIIYPGDVLTIPGG